MILAMDNIGWQPSSGVTSMVLLAVFSPFFLVLVHHFVQNLKGNRVDYEKQDDWFGYNGIREDRTSDIKPHKKRKRMTKGRKKPKKVKVASVYDRSPEVREGFNKLHEMMDDMKKRLDSLK